MIVYSTIYSDSDQRKHQSSSFATVLSLTWESPYLWKMVFILRPWSLVSEVHIAFRRWHNIMYLCGLTVISHSSTLRSRQNGRHFADIFKCIFVNENVEILIKIPLKFVQKGPIDNISALVQIMAWRRTNDGLDWWRICPSLGLNELSLVVCFMIMITLPFNSSPLVPHICVSQLGQHWFR